MTLTRFVAAVVLVAASSLPKTPLPQIGEKSDGLGTIVVQIDGLRNSHGQVKCHLFASEEGFPTQPAKALMGTHVQPLENKARVVFEHVPAGVYAVAFLHDENGNDKMDTGFLGIPREGSGASNNARGKRGPPKWNDAAFQFVGGKAVLNLTPDYP